MVRLHYHINAAFGHEFITEESFQKNPFLKPQYTALWNQRDRKLATECIKGMYIEILQSEPGEEDHNT